MSRDPQPLCARHWPWRFARRLRRRRSRIPPRPAAPTTAPAESRPSPCQDRRCATDGRDLRRRAATATLVRRPFRCPAAAPALRATIAAIVPKTPFRQECVRLVHLRDGGG